MAWPFILIEEVTQLSERDRKATVLMASEILISILFASIGQAARKKYQVNLLPSKH